jgi:hypothetical protein
VIEIAAASAGYAFGKIGEDSGEAAAVKINKRVYK